MTKCPICGKGVLKSIKKKHEMFGIDLGTYSGEKCSSCGEVFTDSSEMIKIEEVAKKKGIWGLGKKTVIAKTGNSLAVRIPKQIANFLNIKEGKGVFIHPDKNKLVIDLV